MKVVIIGSGNVATVLGKKMKAKGVEILQVLSPNQETGTKLSAVLCSTYASNLLNVSLEGEIYMIAVPDKVISSIAANLKLNDKYVVHTAGSVSIKVLNQDGIASCKHGVIYPLQTLNKNNINLPTIPVLIDGDSTETKKELSKFCSLWADNYLFANDDERLKMHVAAVISTNFTNYMYTVAEQFCSSEKLNFNMLLPLIEETALRLKSNFPQDVQTGPAVRGDVTTVDNHLALLQKYPEIQEVYKMLSSKIAEHFKK
jgi:predicted short-subunit dehydrogenase-like oxidoreductase (DUF2520 family)